MDAEINGAFVAVAQVLSEGSNQANTLIGIQFRRQYDEPFARQLRVAAQTGVLRSIPERGAILRPRHVVAARELLRQYNLLVHHIIAGRVVVSFPGTLIADELTRTIGHSTSDPGPLAPGEMLAAQEVDRHRAGDSRGCNGRTDAPVPGEC
jgi:hypothetical protein